MFSLTKGPRISEVDLVFLTPMGKLAFSALLLHPIPDIYILNRITHGAYDTAYISSAGIRAAIGSCPAVTQK
jgi:hypothetical protein